MLPSRDDQAESVRLATTDDYDSFFVAADFKASVVSPEQALEESFFLGLRLNRGVEMERLRAEFGEAADKFAPTIEELVEDGLLIRSGENLRLTKRGRLLSNEVFGKFIGLDRSVVS
jgi:oxygen-independent coproporphyrinogen III oxidase